MNRLYIRSAAFSSRIAKWQESGIHVENWAWESHALAERTVYPELVPKVPVEPPVPVHSCTDANNIGERMMHSGLYAGQACQDSAAPVNFRSRSHWPACASP